MERRSDRRQRALQAMVARSMARRKPSFRRDMWVDGRPTNSAVVKVKGGGLTAHADRDWGGEAGSVLLCEHVFSVATEGFRQAVDVAVCDANRRAVRCLAALGRDRTLKFADLHDVWIMPAGSLQAHGIRPGTVLSTRPLPERG